MIKTIFFVLALFVLTCVFGQQKAILKSDYRFSLQVKIGNLRESIKVNDPAFRLSRGPKNHIIGGFQFTYHYSAKSRFLLDYQYESLGHSPLFANPIGLGATSTISNFHRIALLFEKDVFPIESKSRLNIFFRVGPSISLATTPDDFSTAGFFTLNAANDTLESLFDTSKTNQPAFLSLGGSIGLRYSLSNRWFIAGTVSRFWNISSTHVTATQVGYKAHDLPGYQRANISTNGNILSYQLTLGYNIGKRKDTAAERRLLAKGIKWPERKFAVMIKGGNVYPTLRITDPAGYLSRSSGYETNFGISLRYRIKNRWHMSIGVEGFPNAIDARLKGEYGPDGGEIKAAIQIPVNAEYNVYSLRKRVKMDVFFRSGFLVGFQPFPSNISRSHIAPIESIYIQPTYYAERESKVLVNKSYWAFNTGIEAYLHINKDIFLTGYVNRQMAIGNRPFIQSQVEYAVAPNQPQWYKADLHSTGSAWIVGWGLGFRF